MRMHANDYEIQELSRGDFPSSLLEIPEPPKKLYLKGTLPNHHEYYYLAVVGSRKYTSYGREALERIVAGLRGYPIVIVSGLALGIDGIAHRVALDNNIRTIAIPGSGLNDRVLYPRTHVSLAHEIVENGGALLSEYEPLQSAAPWMFPQRNRIMAGLTQSTLVIEAEEKSGTLITARLALDYNRNVFAVPGSIFSAPSKGANALIRQGATPITSAEDLLLEIGFQNSASNESEQNQQQLDLSLFSKEEQHILLLLEEPRSRDELFIISELPSQLLLSTLTILEIKGAIIEKLGKLHRS